MNKKVKKGIKIGIASLTGVIVLLVLYMLVCNVIAVKTSKPVNYFGYSYSYVPTSSMEPTIKAGDTIIFKKCSYESLKVGDIIVYQSKEGSTKGLYIIHRIKDITEDGFKMLGDNNHGIVDKEVVTKDMLIGKYVRQFNFLNLGKLASNKSLIYGVLVLFFLAIIVLESVNIILTQKRQRIEKEKGKLKTEVLEDMRKELLKELIEEQKQKDNNK